MASTRSEGGAACDTVAQQAPGTESCWCTTPRAAHSTWANTFHPHHALGYGFCFSSMRKTKAQGDQLSHSRQSGDGCQLVMTPETVLTQSAGVFLPHSSFDADSRIEAEMQIGGCQGPVAYFGPSLTHLLPSSQTFQNIFHCLC